MHTPSKDNTRLLWLDLEMCNLDATAPILEVAAIVTDASLNELDTFDRVIHIDTNTLAQTLSQWSFDVHSKNGLLHEVAISVTSLHDAETELLHIIDKHTARGGPDYYIMIAGSSIHYDRAAIGASMPRLFARLNFRQFDVTTLISSLRFWGDAHMLPPPPHKSSIHRASVDVRDSLDAARHIREVLFNGEPVRA